MYAIISPHMNNTLINRSLKYAIITGLAFIPFIPLYVADPLFFPFITGKAFAFRVIVEIILALWLILVLREKGTTDAGTERSVAPRINSMTIAVTVFALVALVADLAGLNPLRSIWSNFERMEGWMTIVHLWAYFIVLSSIFGASIDSHEGRKNWHRFINVVLVASAVTAIYGLFQFFGWAETHQGATRVDASLGNSAYMAVYMLMSVFLAGYMAFTAYAHKLTLKGSTGIFVWIYGFLGAFFSFIMFQTATRGSILGWIAAILVVCAIYVIFGKKGEGQSNRSRALAGGIIGLTIILGILFYFNRDAQWIQKNAVLGRLATISLSDTKTQARGFVWPMAVKGTFESAKTSIIGIGQENFNYLFNSHYDPKMFAHEQWFDRAHSVYLDWLVAGGLLGLIAYLALYILALIYIIRSNLSLGQKAMLVGLLVGYSIHNVFVFDNQTSYVMFFTFLAFVHSFRNGKVPKLLHDTKKSVGENYATIRDYIFVPIIILAFGSALYFINIRPIQANTRLIDALRACSNPQTVTTEVFKRALSLDQTVANQETREQIYTCASNVIRGNSVPEEKTNFYLLAKTETENQIADTPHDARIHIISGSFFNSLQDYETAQPLLERAVELSPTKQTIIFELVLNYINTGKTKEALALIEKAYLSAPENDTAKVAYIVTLIADNQEKKARELFPNNPELFSDPRVISAYVSTKQYAKAIEIYKEALKNSPDNQELYSSLASVYLMNKQDWLAIQTLRDAGVRFPALKTQIDSFIKQIQDGTLKF
jgi:tetratricopeptide (TPR) repeat protein